MEPKPHIELAGTVTLGPKGQVVIPADVREKMDIKPGDKMIALYLPGKGAVSFVSESRMRYYIDKMGQSIQEIQSVLDQQ